MSGQYYSFHLLVTTDVSSNAAEERWHFASVKVVNRLCICFAVNNFVVTLQRTAICCVLQGPRPKTRDQAILLQQTVNGFCLNYADFLHHVDVIVKAIRRQFGRLK